MMRTRWPDNLSAFKAHAAHATTNGECVEWPRSFGSHGYGQFTQGGQVYTSHRAAYEAAKGEIPPGALIRHTCDNRKCINPAHLVLGDHKSNADDMVQRGRSRAGRTFPDQLKLHCKRGHPLAGDNVRHSTSGRQCRACDRIREAQRTRRTKGNAAGLIAASLT